jgi:hypothetical protein
VSNRKNSQSGTIICYRITAVPVPFQALTNVKFRVLSEKGKQLGATLNKIIDHKRVVEKNIGEVQSKLDGADLRNIIAGDVSSPPTREELEAQKRQLNMEMEACKLKRKVFQAQYSTTPQLEEEAVLLKQRQLLRFQDQDRNLRTAIQNLREGIRSTQERSAHANKVAFSHIKRCLRDIFAHVVPTKRVELQAVGVNIEVRPSEL